MDIILHIKEKKKDTIYTMVSQEYIKRLSPYCKIKINYYLDAAKIVYKNNSYRTYVVQGKNSVSSENFANLIVDLNVHGKSCIEFIIGEEAPDNESPIFNLCSFELNNHIISAVLLEQIYRAYTIINGIEYHK